MLLICKSFYMKIALETYLPSIKKGTRAYLLIFSGINVNTKLSKFQIKAHIISMTNQQKRFLVKINSEYQSKLL